MPASQRRLHYQLHFLFQTQPSFPKVKIILQNRYSTPPHHLPPSQILISLPFCFQFKKIEEKKKTLQTMCLILSEFAARLQAMDKTIPDVLLVHLFIIAVYTLWVFGVLLGSVMVAGSGHIGIFGAWCGLCGMMVPCILAPTLPHGAVSFVQQAWGNNIRPNLARYLQFSFAVCVVVVATCAVGIATPPMLDFVSAARARNIAGRSTVDLFCESPSVTNLSAVPDQKYFALKTGQWYVDSRFFQALVADDEGPIYYTAPLKMKNGGELCVFDPPVRAVCGVPFSREQTSKDFSECGWDAEISAETTIIRRIDAARSIDSDIRHRAEQLDHDSFLIEFNSEPHSIIIDEAESAGDAAESHTKLMLFIWAGLVLILIISITWITLGDNAVAKGISVTSGSFRSNPTLSFRFETPQRENSGENGSQGEGAGSRGEEQQDDEEAAERASEMDADVPDFASEMMPLTPPQNPLDGLERIEDEEEEGVMEEQKDDGEGEITIRISN